MRVVVIPMTAFNRGLKTAIPHSMRRLIRQELLLTAIGAPGPNLFIAAEIKHHQFKVAGGSRGLKVSWQVTGIRQDASAVWTFREGKSWGNSKIFTVQDFLLVSKGRWV